MTTRPKTPSSVLALALLVVGCEAGSFGNREGLSTALAAGLRDPNSNATIERAVQGRNQRDYCDTISFAIREVNRLVAANNAQVDEDRVAQILDLLRTLREVAGCDGSTRMDAGVPDADSGTSDADVGVPDSDAGVPDADAGMPDADAGPSDSGMPDSGPPADGGTPPTGTACSGTPGNLGSSFFDPEAGIRVGEGVPVVNYLDESGAQIAMRNTCGAPTAWYGYSESCGLCTNHARNGFVQDVNALRAASPNATGYIVVTRVREGTAYVTPTTVAQLQAVRGRLGPSFPAHIRLVLAQGSVEFNDLVVPNCTGNSCSMATLGLTVVFNGNGVCTAQGAYARFGANNI